MFNRFIILNTGRVQTVIHSQNTYTFVNTIQWSIKKEKRNGASQ